jgi:hypothetical protein
LGPEDAAEFDRQWRAVMVKATETLDLSDVHRTLTAWCRIAWLTADALRHRRTVLGSRWRRLISDPAGRLI